MPSHASMVKAIINKKYSLLSHKIPSNKARAMAFEIYNETIFHGFRVSGLLIVASLSHGEQGLKSADGGYL